MLRRLMQWMQARSGRPAGGAQPLVAFAPGRAWPQVRAGTTYLLLALALPAFFLFYGLGAFPLRDNNEGLYAGIAREMLASGDYIVPRLNGVPYLEKPPLLYWLAALSMALLGQEPAAARLASAASMYALCIGLFCFCRAYGSVRAGCLAAIGLASALPVALLAHVVLFDPLLAALVGGCLLCYLHAHLSGSRGALRSAAVLLALAVLEKGGVALVLAGGTVLLFLLLVRERRAWRQLLDPVALALFLLVAGWWHVLAAQSQPGFAWFYFVNEHLLRFLGQRLPDDYHHGPVWFYLPRLPLMVLPWTPFLLLLARPPATLDPGRRAILRFCQAALLFPLAFFSLSQAKADYYLLVAAPPLALWLALEVEAQLHRRGNRLVALCWALSLGLAAAVALLAPAVPVHRPGQAVPLLPFVVALALAAAGYRAFLQLRAVAARERALLGIALLAAASMPLLLDVAAARGGRDSSVQLARIIEAQPGQPRQVFIYRDFEDMFSTLPFYLRRPLPLIDPASDDLLFGCTHAPGKYCISAEDFRRARRNGPVAVVLQASRADEFLRMAGAARWRMEWVGEKVILMDTPP